MTGGESMIFVTVGTHEQQFNRLVEYVDNLKKDELIKEDVIIQTGYSTYIPQYCIAKQFFTYTEMLKRVKQARVVITHGGPSSFIMPLQIGKIPIVVPRQKRFDEHVNDHQLEFCNEVAKREGNIIVVNDISELGDIIKKYDEVICQTENGRKSNNAKFCKDFETIVNEIMRK